MPTLVIEIKGSQLTQKSQRLVDLVDRRCRVLSQRHFPKGDFPMDIFPSGIFPNVQFSKGQLPKGTASNNWDRVLWQQCARGPSSAARTDWGPSAAATIDLGNCRLINCTFGKLTLG